jgi:hypothetical protein
LAAAPLPGPGQEAKALAAPGDGDNSAALVPKSRLVRDAVVGSSRNYNYNMSVFEGVNQRGRYAGRREAGAGARSSL